MPVQKPSPSQAAGSQRASSHHLVGLRAGGGCVCAEVPPAPTTRIQPHPGGCASHRQLSSAVRCPPVRDRASSKPWLCPHTLSPLPGLRWTYLTTPTDSALRRITHLVSVSSNRTKWHLGGPRAQGVPWVALISEVRQGHRIFRWVNRLFSCTPGCFGWLAADKNRDHPP